LDTRPPGEDAALRIDDHPVRLWYHLRPPCHLRAAERSGYPGRCRGGRQAQASRRSGQRRQHSYDRRICGIMRFAALQPRVWAAGVACCPC
jgi:hypothetical protein